MKLKNPKRARLRHPLKPTAGAGPPSLVGPDALDCFREGLEGGAGSNADAVDLRQNLREYAVWL